MNKKLSLWGSLLILSPLLSAFATNLATIAPASARPKVDFIDFQSINNSDRLYELCRLTSSLTSYNDKLNSGKIDYTFYVNKGFTTDDVLAVKESVSAFYGTHTTWVTPEVVNMLVGRILNRVDNLGVKYGFYSVLSDPLYQKGELKYYGLRVRLPKLDLSYVETIPRGRTHVWDVYQANNLPLYTKLTYKDTFNLEVDVWNSVETPLQYGRNPEFYFDLADVRFEARSNTCFVVVDPPSSDDDPDANKVTW